MLHIKPGVKLLGLAPQLVLALAVADRLYEQLGADLVVTSCTDGRHSRASLHYVGHAVDLRTRNLSPEQVDFVARKLHEHLGIEFDVVIESDHLHIEWQPKGGSKDEEA